MTPRCHNNDVAEIKVRQLPEWVVAVHKQQAHQMGMSLEQHLRIIITELAGTHRRSFLQTAKICRETLERELGGTLTNRTADLVCEMQDERG